MLQDNKKHLNKERKPWKFGKQVIEKNIKVIQPLYSKFLNSKTEKELIDSFLELSEFFVENREKIRSTMREREFASLVGFRLEEFVYQVATMMKEKHQKTVEITAIEGKRCKMIIYERNNKWIGQGADLVIGNWEYKAKYKDEFFVPKIIIESKRYIALAPQLRDLGMLALKWKEKYPDVSFFVFSEHNDLDPQSAELMLECWGRDIDDLFFIKKGSRNIERKGINIFLREEVERFVKTIDVIFSNI